MVTSGLWIDMRSPRMTDLHILITCHGKSNIAPCALDQVKSIQDQWNQVKSIQDQWNQVESSGIK